jgi:tripartite-type tricarboxylate transporter receptor subunit TctC
MTIRRAVLLTAIVAPFLAGAFAPAQADDFYKGKTITMIVGFTPGGGYDQYARGVSRYIANHIPGKPAVIVQNLPGAGSLTAVRAVGTSQPKDGTVLVTFNPGLITQSIVEPEKVQLDFAKYAWVGIVTPDFRVCYGYGPKAPKTWDEMMKRKEFILGGTGKGSGNYINGATLREVFGAPIKQILGFPGSADQRLAIERGELDGDCGSYSSIPADWIRDKKVVPFVRFTEEKAPGMEADAPYIASFATKQEQKDLLEVLDAEDEVGRSLMMSRDVPADRIAIMRKAFDETMKDPAFLADMEKQNAPVLPRSGEDADKLVAAMKKVSPEIVEKVKKIYQ